MGTQGSYDEIVKDLFRDKPNVKVQRPPRKTAVDFWNNINEVPKTLDSQNSRRSQTPARTSSPEVFRTPEQATPRPEGEDHRAILAVPHVNAIPYLKAPSAPLEAEQSGGETEDHRARSHRSI